MVNTWSQVNPRSRVGLMLIWCGTMGAGLRCAVFIWSPPGTGVFSDQAAPASRSHSWYKTLTYLRYQDSQIIITRHWSRQNINNAVLITWLRCPAGSNWGEQLEIIKHHKINTNDKTAPFYILLSSLFFDTMKIPIYKITTHKRSILGSVCP